MDRTDPHNLNRFVEAQAGSYDLALSEIRAGRKRSHWMWYIFPQFVGLGSTQMSRRYALGSIAEVDAYLRHPILGSRLVECCKAVLQVYDQSARDIFGSPDDMKLRSCTTLFAKASGSGSIFEKVLDQYFAGNPDQRTLLLIVE